MATPFSIVTIIQKVGDHNYNPIQDPYPLHSAGGQPYNQSFLKVKSLVTEVELLSNFSDSNLA
jgi:hypothetical protein